MRRPLLLAVATATVLLGGCANPDRSEDAGELESALGALPGVETARVDYAKPITLDSGKLAVTVRMADDASAADLVEVGRTTYEAFSDTHAGEEGDVDVSFGDDTLHLRSFDPDAEVEDVAREWDLAARVAEVGALEADLNTQDVGGEGVESILSLTLPEPSGADDVLRALGELEQEHGTGGRRSWGVAASDGSALLARPGFPSAHARQDWGDLQEEAGTLESRAVVGIDLTQVRYRRTQVIESVTMNLTGRSGRLDLTDAATFDAVRDVALAHLDRLAGRSAGFTYDVVVDGESVAFLDPTLCRPSDPELSDLDAALRTPTTCPTTPVGER